MGVNWGAAKIATLTLAVAAIAAAVIGLAVYGSYKFLEACGPEWYWGTTGCVIAVLLWVKAYLLEITRDE